MSKVLSHLYTKFGIARIRTSPYHPQSNGRLEKFHATLKSMLTKLIDARHNWPDFLDIVLHFARSTPHSRHGHTPHELLFLKPTPFILSTLKHFWLHDSGNSVNLPQFVSDIDKQATCTNSVVRETLKTKVAKSRLAAENTALAKLKVGRLVLKRLPGLNKCLESSWEGPFKTVKLISPVNVLIKDTEKNHKTTVVHASQLKLISDPSVYRVVYIIEDPFEHNPSVNNSEKPINLTPDQSAQLDSVFASFSTVFSDTPGLTNTAEHSITLSSTTPV